MVMIKYPSQAKELPLDFDIQMLEGIRKHCIAKGIKIKVKPTDAISKKTYAPEMELLDLVDWTLKGLFDCFYSDGKET